jgi:restriction system protein
VARTGIFVEIQREIARQQRERQRANAAYVRAQNQARIAVERAEREAMRTAAVAVRLADQQARSDARARAEAEKKHKQAYVEAQQATVAQKNADLNAAISELEQLLEATHSVDDYVDFETLKKDLRHSPFDPGPLGRSVPRPVLEALPVEPNFEKFAPIPPAGFAKFFGGKSKYEKAMASARQEFEQSHLQWQRYVGAARQKLAEAKKRHEAAEQARRNKLAEAEKEYLRECEERSRQIAEHNADVNALASAFAKREPQAIVEYFTLVLANSHYPSTFPQRYRLAFVPESKQLVVEYELPSIVCIPTAREFRYIKSRDEITSVGRPPKEIRALYSSVVAQVTLRTLHEIFEADRSGLIETVVFNGIVTTIDPGTGQQIKPCLVTVRVTRDIFNTLELTQVDPLACLERLNASVSKKPSELAPVRPVLEFDMVDKRFVEETDIISGLDHRPNLLELTPTEFESLIQNLFTKMGLDTKQTRPSRDGGVDCVAFDPRPIFGGKVVIQAKRYRNTVDVSSVRDLFGTVQNEGAAKGILVTTSGFGQASFEFAKNKPLELIDGSNLLYLLAEHAGLEAKIAASDISRPSVS